MKKIRFSIFLIVIFSLLLVSCGTNNISYISTDEELVTDSNSSKSVSEYAEEQALEVFCEENESEFANHIFKIVNEKYENSSGFQTNQAGQNGIYMYSFDDLDGYSLFNKYEAGSCFVYSTYYSDYLNQAKAEGFVSQYETMQHTILFTWAFGFDNEEDYLQGKINYWNSEGWPVNEIANKPGYYYIDCDTYQNYFWCEDGYAFELQIPTSVGSVNPETHEYSGEDVFALKKTFYPFEENEVVE